MHYVRKRTQPYYVRAIDGSGSWYRVGNADPPHTRGLAGLAVPGLDHLRATLPVAGRKVVAVPLPGELIAGMAVEVAEHRVRDQIGHLHQLRLSRIVEHGILDEVASVQRKCSMGVVIGGI